MRRGKGFLLLVMVAGMTAGTSGAQDNLSKVTDTSQKAGESTGRSLTLQEAEAIAIRNNPQITVGKLRALQAREFVREARSALFPTAPSR